ncbi:PilN domain-containing protein, partial [Chloroflexota bacterium]
LRQEESGLFVNRGSHEETLHIITGNIPPGVAYISIAIGDEGFEVAGEAQSYDGVFAYALALQNQGVFPDIRIRQVDEKGEEGESITFVLEAAAGITP